jgi:hypothetical protein
MKNNFGVKALTPLVLVIVLLAMISGTVRAELKEQELQVRCWGSKTEIPYERIQNLQLLESFSLGSRNFGVSNLRIDSGTYLNGQLGYYKISACKKTKIYILLEREGEEAFVFNLPDEQQTREFYARLQERVQQS